MFAAVALTLVTNYPGGRAENVYSVAPLTPWFVQYDSAVLAQMNVKAPEGTFPYVLGEEQIVDGQVTLPADTRFPQAPPLPVVPPSALPPPAAPVSEAQPPKVVPISPLPPEVP
jgi:hypothetical protein